MDVFYRGAMTMNPRTPFRRLTRLSAAAGTAAGLTLAGTGAAGAATLDDVLAPVFGSSSEVPGISDLLPALPGIPGLPLPGVGDLDDAGAGDADAPADADRDQDATAKRIEKVYEEAYSDQAAGYERDAALDQVAEDDLDAFLAGDRSGYDRQEGQDIEGAVTYVKKDADGRAHYIQELDRGLVDDVLAEKGAQSRDAAGRDHDADHGSYGLAVREHEGKYYVAVVMDPKADAAKDDAAPASGTGDAGAGAPARGAGRQDAPETGTAGEAARDGAALPAAAPASATGAAHPA